MTVITVGITASRAAALCVLSLGRPHNTDHASGPESVASDVDDPADFVNEADVDDVEDDAERSNDKLRDAECKQLDVTERRDHVARVTKVQH